MPANYSKPLPVADTVKILLMAHAVPSNHPISISGIIAEIRRQLPKCEHTDDELETLIATQAISMGINVAFDRPYFTAGWPAVSRGEGSARVQAVHDAVPEPPS